MSTIERRLLRESFGADHRGKAVVREKFMKHSNGKGPASGRVRLTRMRVPGTVRLLICDDHTLFREGIKAILRADPTIEVVGESTDGKQAVDDALRLRPDVVLMDVSMPALVGYEAVRRIAKMDKRIKILVLTMYQEEEIIGLCLNAGASGYILKDVPAAQLLEAIHSLHKGEKYLGPLAMQAVVNQYVEGAPAPRTRYDTLSNREREVLKLLADGLTVKDIATRLNLSLKTVDVHKYNLMRKLDLHNRTELIKYALRRKLIEFPAVFSNATHPRHK